MRVAYLLAVALLIGGCATNTLRRERAAEVVDEGGPLVAVSSQLLDTIARTNREAGIELALADPFCDWPETNLATGTPASSPCDPASSKHKTFGSIGTDEFAPTVQSIAALSAYLAAVGDIVTGASGDAGVNLAKAKATIEGVLGGITSVTGAASPIVFSDDRKVAVDGIVAMVDTLLREAEQARQLKAVEANNPKLREVTAALRRDLANWSTLVLVSDLDTIQTALTQRWQNDRMLRMKPVRTADERSRLLDDEARRRLLDTRLGVRDRLADAGRLPRILSAAVDDFEAAHDSYVNALQDKSLTPENRERRAQITRERLRQSLALLVQTIAAFK